MASVHHQRCRTATVLQPFLATTAQSVNTTRLWPLFTKNDLDTVVLSTSFVVIPQPGVDLSFKNSKLHIVSFAVGPLACARLQTPSPAGVVSGWISRMALARPSQAVPPCRLSGFLYTSAVSRQRCNVATGNRSKRRKQLYTKSAENKDSAAVGLCQQVFTELDAVAGARVSFVTTDKRDGMTSSHFVHRVYFVCETFCLQAAEQLAAIGWCDRTPITTLAATVGLNAERIGLGTLTRKATRRS